MGSKFGNFGGFGWVRSLILVKKPGFGPGFGPFLAEQVQSSGFLELFERVQSSVLVNQPGFK